MELHKVGNRNRGKGCEIYLQRKRYFRFCAVTVRYYIPKSALYAQINATKLKCFLLKRV